MTEPLKFFANGTPSPGGSKTAFAIRNKHTGHILTRANGYPIINMADAGGEKTKTWRKCVAFAGRAAMAGNRPFAEPLAVIFELLVSRPKSHYRTGRHALLLRPDAPMYPAVKPDVLKLARSTEDALTGIVWADDALIVNEAICKRYVRGSECTGANVSVFQLSEQLAPIAAALMDLAEVMDDAGGNAK